MIRNDQMIRISIEVPKRLTKDQRKRLEEYAEACGDPANPVSESFVEKAKKFFK